VAKVAAVDIASFAQAAAEARSLPLGIIQITRSTGIGSFGISPMRIFRPLLRKALQRNGTTLVGANSYRISVQSKRRRVPRLPIAKSASISKRDSRIGIRLKRKRYGAICNMRAIQAGMAYWRRFETGSQFRYASGLSLNPVPQAHLIQTY
jgi:hypothetical protein